MAFLLDHLAAVLVGATLLVALVVVQQRGQQSAIDATARYASQRHTSGLVTTLERDLENVRTRAQTEVAFGGSGGAGLPRYRFTLRRATGTDGETYTSQVSFPTLQDPTLGAASPVVIVAYHVEPTAESVLLDGARRPLYAVTRYEYARGDAVRARGTTERVVDFEVTAFAADGTPIQSSSRVDPTPPRLAVEVVTAPDRPDRRASDQRMAATASRHARTVRVHGAGARGGRPPVDPSTEAGIPPFPGDPPPPPPPSGTGSGGGTAGGGTGGGTSGEGAPSAPRYPVLTDSTLAF